jgi:hypothetical protein
MSRYGLGGDWIKQTMGKIQRVQLRAVRRIYSCQDQCGTHLFHYGRVLPTTYLNNLPAKMQKDTLPQYLNQE